LQVYREDHHLMAHGSGSGRVCRQQV